MNSINPIAVNLFGLEIRWYGILIAIGALLAVFITENMAKRKKYINGMYESISTDISIIVLLFGVLGARLYYVIFEWEYYSKHLDEILAIRNGGLAIYGGISAGLISLYIFCKIKNIKFLTLADCIAPGLALAQSIGRWGNFINGEAHGGVTDVSWAIIVNGERVHPTFFYESFVNFCLFIFLYFYLSKRQKFEGQIMSIYFIVYGIARFFIEGMRTDSLYLGSFRVSQIVSIVLVIIGLIIYLTNNIYKVNSN